MHLNYHHLRYFWAIAHDGGLTKAARRLRVSPSALSIQLKQFEHQIGQQLFERTGKRLVLTEVGRLVFDYASTIVQAGDELVGTLQGHAPSRRRIVRVGALTTLSRNFQLEFVKPLLERDDVDVAIRSGSLRELLGMLDAQLVDVVLTNTHVRRDTPGGLHVHLLAEQPVSLVSRPGRRTATFRFPEDLRGQPILLPGQDSDIRAGFDRLLSLAQVRPTIAAEVDDMAMLRLLARETGALALVPPIVVRDELAARTLVERCRVPNLTERFYAIVRSRRFPNPLVADLLRAMGR